MRFLHCKCFAFFFFRTKQAPMPCNWDKQTVQGLFIKYTRLRYFSLGIGGTRQTFFAIGKNSPTRQVFFFYFTRWFDFRFSIIQIFDLINEFLSLNYWKKLNSSKKVITIFLKLFFILKNINILKKRWTIFF